MQKDGDAVPQVDVCHMKSPAHDSQHGVGTLGLQTRYNLTPHPGKPQRCTVKAKHHVVGAGSVNHKVSLVAQHCGVVHRHYNPVQFVKRMFYGITFLSRGSQLESICTPASSLR